MVVERWEDGKLIEAPALEWLVSPWDMPATHVIVTHRVEEDPKPITPTDDASIRIGIDNEAMRRDIGRPETLARLGAIAGKVWGRELRVEVGPVPAEQAADTPLGRARRKTEATLADPLVQAAVEIFGGEVRGVRDRRER